MLDALVDMEAGEQAPTYSVPIEAERNEIHLSIYRQLSAVEPEWRAFERQADGTVFQTFDFLATYCQHVGLEPDVMPVIIVGRESEGNILFLMPLGIVKTGSTRRLAWFGSELCDYNGPLLAPGFSSRVDRRRFIEIWQEITALLRADRALRYDVVDLEKMPKAVGGQANPFLFLEVDLHPSGAYRTTLMDEWRQFYLAKRSSLRRRRDRAKRRKLAAYGAVRFVTQQRNLDIARAIDLLIVQKSESFVAMGVRNIFERPGYRAFFHELATNAHSKSIVHVSHLEVGDTIAAVNLGLQYRGNYYHLLTSYSRGGTSRFGPGATHLQYLMRYASEQRCNIFDFTIGDESYKREWCETVTDLYDHISGENKRGAIVALIMRFSSRLKRRIKHTPMLWSLFVKVRASKNSLRSNFWALYVRVWSRSRLRLTTSNCSRVSTGPFISREMRALPMHETAGRVFHER